MKMALSRLKPLPQRHGFPHASGRFPVGAASAATDKGGRVMAHFPGGSGTFE